MWVGDDDGEVAYLDTNADFTVSALDALQIINHLNRDGPFKARPSSGGGGSQNSARGERKSRRASGCSDTNSFARSPRNKKSSLLDTVAHVLRW